MARWNLPTACWNLPMARWNLPTACWNLPMACWNLPMACWNFPMACWNLPTARWNLPTARWILPTAARYGKGRGSVRPPDLASHPPGLAGHPLSYFGDVEKEASFPGTLSGCRPFLAGLKENLVERLAEWPGAHAVQALLTGEPLEGTWFDPSRSTSASRSST